MAREYKSLHLQDDHGYDINTFLIPPHYEGTLDKVLIPYGMIRDRVEKMAHDILLDYRAEQKTIHLLCVLKGGSAFFQDLTAAMRKLHAFAGQTHIPFTFDFIRVKSYEGTNSSGRVTITGINPATLRGKHLVLVEDIIDTGLTMAELLQYLPQHEPASIRVATLLEKRTHKSNGYVADYAGFSIPDVFVIGYGLDYNEMYRELEPICVINRAGIERFADADEPHEL